MYLYLIKSKSRMKASMKYYMKSFKFIPLLFIILNIYIEYYKLAVQMQNNTFDGA
jgi:hypothetical protein